MHTTAQPSTAAGLYDPAFDHDACGVAFVARLDREPTHDVVDRGLLAIEHLFHRGATGADPETGDGAGLLLGIPDALLRAAVPFELPRRRCLRRRGRLLPPGGRAGARTSSAPGRQAVHGEGQHVLGWRDVPIAPEHCGRTARGSMPRIRQLFIGAEGPLASDQDAFERKLYVIRRTAERHGGPDLVVPSCSSRTIVYKGMLTSLQLRHFYPDLADPRCASQVALVHSRFSTNTFPSWELAHPYRMIAHNGEINTLMGNRNWMRARETQLASELWGDDLPKVLPERPPGRVGLGDLRQRARAAHAVRALGPARDDDDDPRGVGGPRRHAGGAARLLRLPLLPHGAVGRPGRGRLHRRPRRRRDAGPQRPAPRPLGRDPRRLRRARLRERRPAAAGGDDPAQGPAAARATCSSSTSSRAASSRTRRSSGPCPPSGPYGEWYSQQAVHFDDLPRAEPTMPRTEPLHRRQLAFGYSQEDLRVLLAPMAQTGAEPTGSMGNDLALAVLSDKQPVAVLLLQAALRAGHQPGDRPDPRVDRDEPGDRRRRRAQPARGDARSTRASS